MTLSFAVTFDYRCPFARNAHEAVVAGLREGRDWSVRFLPFSLDQAHAGDDEIPVWDRTPGERGTGVLALEWGLAVRDWFPDQFLDWHVAAFAARHDHARQIREESVLRDVAASVGLDPDVVADVVDGEGPLRTLAKEHTEATGRFEVWGVPTFVTGDEAAFVRFMDRGNAAAVDRMLELMAWTELNEFKRTRIPR